MKGLDGIQGPIYVGTGCVFRRQAFYGNDAPKTKKPPTRTCNCWPNWCCCGCCFSGKKKKKTTKSKSEKKQKKFRRLDSGAPVFALEGIEEGIEGKNYPFKWFCYHFKVFFWALFRKNDLIPEIGSVLLNTMDTNWMASWWIHGKLIKNLHMAWLVIA